MKKLLRFGVGTNGRLVNCYLGATKIRVPGWIWTRLVRG